MLFSGWEHISHSKGDGMSETFKRPETRLSPGARFERDSSHGAFCSGAVTNVTLRAEGIGRPALLVSGSPNGYQSR
jgi:hypothetical protein